MRDRRRAIPAQAQAQVAAAIAATALSQSVFALGEHVALYMAADGEAGTDPLMDALLAAGKHCYLPVLQEETVTLAFRRYLPGQPLTTNFFGLLEPPADAGEILPRHLTTVFMPLVAFDMAGNRLGMGKGYYDRTFAFLLENPDGGPNLVGLAHESQRVEKLEAADWDVPLKGIITGGRLYTVS